MRKIKMIFLAGIVCLLCGCTNRLEVCRDLLKQGKYAEAEAVFREEITESVQIQENMDDERKAADAKVREAEARRGLGIVLYERQKYEEAAAELKKVLELEGKETPAIYNLIGVCAMNLKDYDGAIEAFSAGIALPASEDQEEANLVREMSYNLVICYEKKKDWAGAREAARAYAEAYPQDKEMQKELEFLETR
ncbi:MAG: tetratricopeptide repeat protein [Schaedlerella sp.]|nr:tetratricopeptide repeat protein [Lachnospiraceae bacterium]MDY4203386.1 tetratricopeptide repeat protein [Schaedlerella sp.]